MFSRQPWASQVQGSLAMTKSKKLKSLQVELEEGLPQAFLKAHSCLVEDLVGGWLMTEGGWFDGNTWKNSLMVGKRPRKTQFCAGWFEIFRKDGRLQETG